ncbi:hypothetical protein E2C01_062003 [Portunus trituberculatus]|uniref:Uncharacterized protein n=1 Tax=Portunus trituberculatus TaxID=210409 RepID=A0A5B7HER5_PORTR|nr:hypothetical protein [Portunus trituberculatus]
MSYGTREVNNNDRKYSFTHIAARSHSRPQLDSQYHNLTRHSSTSRFTYHASRLSPRASHCPPPFDIK